MNQTQIVFIGSTVVDVILQLPHLPIRQEDINIQSQSMHIGGCASNASWIAHLLQVPYLLFSPVGTGMYADMVKAELQRRHQPLLLQSEEENGCCYCMVEADGERTFLSLHGAEYHFRREWFSLLPDTTDTVYVCGLEIEEESGRYILEYLQAHPDLTIYFASGPRISHIAKKRLEILFSLHCILHLNEEEALHYTGCLCVEEAAFALYQRTQQAVIITCGAKGCYIQEKAQLAYWINSPRVPIIDTIGAGDAHIGSIIALRKAGFSWPETLRKANIIAAAVVSQQGARLSPEHFQQLIKQHTF